MTTENASEVDLRTTDDHLRDSHLDFDTDPLGEADELEVDTPSERDSVHPPSSVRSRVWLRLLAYVVIPLLVVGLAACAGYLQWRGSSLRAAQAASAGVLPAATDSTIKMLSYKPDTVQKDLESAGEGLTGPFRDSYDSLIHDVVIPGAREKQISAVATVPAAAVVSATPRRAVVMVFVNQTTIVGADPPTSTASTVRVTMERIGQRWLVSDFTPI
ncbi:membrane protein [Mycolicibacterium goodii]|uniref:Membrane protein n=1 Tax=Mycolicibacterium goodii TaxID=134601 RepID=A0A0K0XFL4_MYCGD|nr:membrane protein [Mycolicibacterium goodii]